MASDQFFWAGVIEGFYGKPWSLAERVELFEWMSAWGLNTYLYAPKDDLHHRILWRSPYPPEMLSALSHLVHVCHARGLHFAYGLSPGLDLEYSNSHDLELLRRRYEQVLAAGCRHLCLLFDDIPPRMTPADQARFSSFAAAQAYVANQVLKWIRHSRPGGRLLFCPTAYCDRMSSRGLGGADYLAVLGRELHPDIDVFWTGPEIISAAIDTAQAQHVGAVLRRKPVLWDNLHANDYDGSRFYCGPYSGRDRTLLPELHGIFSNPNCELPLNFVPLRTFAEFVRGRGPWDERSAFLKALEAWQSRFETVAGAAALEDLTTFADCYYLPHQDGPGALRLLQDLHRLLRIPPAEIGPIGRDLLVRLSVLKEFCARLAAIRDRPLFHALSRRVWDLREELDLLEQVIRHNLDGGSQFQPVSSDFHLPGTFRGGVVNRLRQLLTQQSDGSFVPARATPSETPRAPDPE